MTDNKPLAGRAALITGSTSGIGLALADALAKAGANIMLNGLGDRNAIERTRAELAQKHAVDVRYHGADMTRPDEIADLVAQTHLAFGRLDIVIPNAGIQHVAPIEDFPVEKWDAILAINLSAAFHIIRAAVPIMKTQGSGRIVNMASAHALVASPFKSAYVAAKHGLAGLTKTVGLEVAEHGITCNAICPGYVKTPLVEAQIGPTAKARGLSEEEVVRDVLLAAQPTKAFVSYEQLAGMLLYLVSDAGASVNGAMLSIDGGWTAQ
ncbi:MAG: 3-hydroxybutyrate dehydrogenase [Robiginitomaculum sp.]|nr:3-hydroxybutyrate dehydrogenase [Robiginitomaculum sp.]MDQ7077688.1 3-hydroxybutyrate dehydrogenase [Robiginitomaculum sp.]